MIEFLRASVLLSWVRHRVALRLGVGLPERAGSPFAGVGTSGVPTLGPAAWSGAGRAAVVGQHDHGCGFMSGRPIGGEVWVNALGEALGDSGPEQRGPDRRGGL